MTTREEFEAAMQKIGASIERSKPADEAVGIDYQWDDTEFMWYGFKLGRAAALEEAAKIPREYAMDLDKQGWGNRFPDELTAIFNAGTNMAHRIRALKDAP